MIVLSMLSCIFLQQPAIQSVEGTIQSTKGRPVPQARLMITDERQTSAAEQTRSDSTGRFTLPTNNRGLVYVRALAADFLPVSGRVFLDSGSTVAIRMNMAPAWNATTVFDSVVFVTPQGNGEQRFRMKASKGTFTHEVKAPAEPVRYRMELYTGGARAMLCTSAMATPCDHIIAPVGGSSWCVANLPKKGKNLVIQFDPRKRTEAIGTSTVDLLADGDRTLERGLAWNDSLMAAINTAVQDHGNESDSTKTGWLRALRLQLDSIAAARFDQAAAMPPGRMRDVVTSQALIASGNAVVRNAEPDSARTLMNRVPPTSLAWSVTTRNILPIASLADNDDIAWHWMTTFIRAHPNRMSVPGPATALLLNTRSTKRKDSVARIARVVIREFPNHPLISGPILEEFDTDRPIQAGRPLPQFSWPLMNTFGGTVSPQTLHGSYVLIDFWATWCGPCIGELPLLHELYERYRKDGFRVVSVSLDRQESDITTFRSGRSPMPWDHVWLDEGFKNEAATLFEVSAIPKPVLVGPDGTIIAAGHSLRGKALEDALRLAYGH